MIRSAIAIVCITVLCAAVISAQASPRLTFEVASVRPSASGGGRGGPLVGGPGTASPGRITMTRTTIQRLLREAYGVDFDQIQGPDWISEERYDVVANVPTGTTRQQLLVMLRNLIEDRFQLKLRHITRDFPVYELTIARGGAKLKENTDRNLQPLRLGAGPFSADRDGFPQIPAGRSGAAATNINGLTRRSVRGLPLSDLLLQLRAQLGTTTGANTFAIARVIDKTGLTGVYDYQLEFASSPGIGGALALPTDPSAGPTFIDALDKQLGLKLTKSTAPLDVLVIDHIEKTPRDN